MAGAMRKMAVYLGLVEDEDIDGGYDDDADFDERPHVIRRGEEPVLRVTRPDEVAERRPRAAAERHHGVEAVDALEAYRITTVHPRNYNEARVIGEHFRDGTPVIMNLTDMDDSDAKRLVDFAAGLVFGRHGSIERVTQKVFLLTPANVEITAEDKSRLAGAGFFNQS
ncbi:MAG TPA: cell division protein SepF [Mycobacteriales bacterium]|nr:cell division protein SepF [Mycobacteriales bacterium]HWB65760.1 cell division protein SepF [Mycobacteriales bacterium]